MIRLGRRLVSVLLCGLVVGCAGRRLGWTRLRTDPFTLSVEYPPSLFPNGFESRATGGLEWMFGPYGDGSSLLLEARQDSLMPTPYAAACTLECPGETYRLDDKTSGISTGAIGDRVYFSKCVVDGNEMHCMHVIYPASKRGLYADIVARMSATLR